MTRTRRRSGSASTVVSTSGGASPLRGLALASAVSGTVFAVLLVVGLALVRQAPGLGVSDAEYSAFYADGGRSAVLVTSGCHRAVRRDRLPLVRGLAADAGAQGPGERPELPRWLQLASAVVVVCAMFVSSALVGAVALLRVFSADPLPPPEVARALASAGYGVAFVYGVRAAGMFMMTTTALLRHAHLMPRWLVWVSYLLALGLLVSTTFHPAILLVFPLWVVVSCAALLVMGRRMAATTAGSEHP